MKIAVTKEQIEKYIGTKKCAADIARELGCSFKAVSSAAKRHSVLLVCGYKNGVAKNFIDLTGKTIGHIKVVKRVENIKHGKGKSKINWLCICGCGKEFEALTTDLRTGRTRTCGCRLSRVSRTSWKGYGHIGKTYWSSVNSNARQRSLEMTVTIEYVSDLFDKQNKRCALSGVELSMGREQTASLDRIDSKKGYIEGNVQWVHKLVNHIKQKLSDEEFIYWCRKIAEHNKI